MRSPENNPEMETSASPDLKSSEKLTLKDYANILLNPLSGINRDTVVYTYTLAALTFSAVRLGQPALAAFTASAAAACACHRLALNAKSTLDKETFNIVRAASVAAMAISIASVAENELAHPLITAGASDPDAAAVAVEAVGKFSAKTVAPFVTFYAVIKTIGLTGRKPGPPTSV